MISYYFKTVKDSELKLLAEARAGVWVNVTTPTTVEVDRLTKDFALDPDIIKDASDFYEVPRLERSEGATYFFTRYPLVTDDPEGETAPLLLVMGESFVITWSIRENSLLSALVSSPAEIITTQKTKLFIQVMSAVTNAFNVELNRTRKQVHKDRVRLRKIGLREIERLVSYETRLNAMVDTLIPTNAWLQGVPKSGYLELYPDDLDLMEDMIIANNQVVNSARAILKTIQNIRGSIEAIMTSRLNNSLSILTVLTILLTVPLVIASLYGMNVALPFQNHPHTFLFIVGVNVILLTILALIFRRKQWF